MWWRALGVAFVLLCVGVTAGYALADRTAQEPRATDTIEPVPGVSPAVPTPESAPVFPDPTEAPLEAALPAHAEVFRLPKKGAGVVAQIPDGWRISQIGDSTWNMILEGNPVNTYTLRVQLLFALRQSVEVAKGSRILALQQSEAEGNLFEFEVTEESDDAFEATYVNEASYRRVARERFVDFGGTTAYVVVASTGRTVDADGLRDLVNRIADSLVEVRDGEPSPKD